MKIILITLAIIGFLKLVSLFILCIIELYNKIKGTDFIEIHKEYGIYKSSTFCIIPTIEIHCCSCVEITFKWLCFQYYNFYKLIYEKDEK